MDDSNPGDAAVPQQGGEGWNGAEPNGGEGVLYDEWGADPVEDSGGSSAKLKRRG